MATSAKTKLRQKKQTKTVVWLVGVILGTLILISLCIYVFLFSPLFSVRGFNISSDDDGRVLTNSEKDNIQKYLQDNYKNKNIFRLSESQMEESLKDNFEDVKEVTLDRTWSGLIKATVHAYKSAFVGCEKDRQFLISCMYAESDGIFYKEAAGEAEDARLHGVYFFEFDKDALALVESDKDTLENRLNSDSLVGMRLYSQEEMKKIFALLSYFERNGYFIKEVQIKGLKVVDIGTSKYTFVLSLTKGFDETIKDFEAFSSNEATKKVLLNPDLERIDLSFKDKIFYKLHVVATSTVLASTTSTTTLLNTSTTTILDATATSSSQ
jgi:hypothetical protein